MNHKLYLAAGFYYPCGDANGCAAGGKIVNNHRAGADNCVFSYGFTLNDTASRAYLAVFFNMDISRHFYTGIKRYKIVEHGVMTYRAGVIDKHKSLPTRISTVKHVRKADYAALAERNVFGAYDVVGDNIREKKVFAFVRIRS